MIGRRLEADAAELSAAQLAQEVFGGALEVDVPAGAQGAPAPADRLEQCDRAGRVLRVVRGLAQDRVELVADLEALDQGRRITSRDEEDRPAGDVEEVEGGVADGTARGEAVGSLLIVEPGPEDARRVEDRQVAVELDALGVARDGGLVAGLRDAAPGQRVDERRLPDVRNPDHHRPQRPARAPAIRRELATAGQQRPHALRVDHRERERPRPRPGLEPIRRHVGIREVGLRQDRLDRLLRGELREQRVAAREGEPRVDELDHDVDVLQRVGDLAPGAIHVSGEPVDRHRGPR